VRSVWSIYKTELLLHKLNLAEPKRCLSNEILPPSLSPGKRAGHRSVSLHIFAARAAVDNYIGQKTIFLQSERSDTVFSLMSNSTNQFCVDTPAQRGATGQSAHKSSPFITLRARACAHAIVRANVVEMRTQSRGINPRSARIARNARNVWSTPSPRTPSRSKYLRYRTSNLQNRELYPGAMFDGANRVFREAAVPAVKVCSK